MLRGGRDESGGGGGGHGVNISDCKYEGSTHSLNLGWWWTQRKDGRGGRKRERLAVV